MCGMQDRARDAAQDWTDRGQWRSGDVSSYDGVSPAESAWARERRIRSSVGSPVISGGCHADERLDVDSGAEGCLACAGEEDRLHARSGVGDDVAKLAQVLRMQDAALLRPVEVDRDGTAACCALTYRMCCCSYLPAR